MNRLLSATSAVIMLCAPISAQMRDKRVVPVDPNTRQKFERQVKVALLVGVGNYDPATGLGALKYPAVDVELLGKELERQGYLVRPLVDAKATRGIIRRTLTELAAALDPNQGTFLFYFSGHGFQQDGRNYLATFGSTADDLKSEGLAVAEVEALLKDSKARQSMMFIDACRNDPAAGARSVAGARSFATLNAAQGMRVLYSTRSGRVSYESDELKQGVFTHFMVEGLKGGAAGADGLVTFRDLADYVIDQTRGYGVKSGQVQVPYEAGESSGDFLLAKATAGAPTMTKVELPPPVANAAAPNTTAPIERATQSVDGKVNPKDGLKYVWIAPGKFTMGCSPGDDECRDTEKPAHEATIAKGFWLGQTLVTVAAWKRYAGATGAKMPDEAKIADRSVNPGWSSEQAPITMVNWLEAKAYCEWSGGRLPTDAEWEFAARAGTTASRYGDLDAIAWYSDNSGKARLDGKLLTTLDMRAIAQRLNDNVNIPHPVGTKQKNAWGLFDMLGNAYQWTADTIHASTTLGPRRTYRVIRGGGFATEPAAVRVSLRKGLPQEDRNPTVGFRCASE